MALLKGCLQIPRPRRSGGEERGPPQPQLKQKEDFGPPKSGQLPSFLSSPKAEETPPCPDVADVGMKKGPSCHFSITCNFPINPTPRWGCGREGSGAPRPQPRCPTKAEAERGGCSPLAQPSPPFLERSYYSLMILWKISLDFEVNWLFPRCGFFTRMTLSSFAALPEAS